MLRLRTTLLVFNVLIYNSKSKTNATSSLNRYSTSCFIVHFIKTCCVNSFYMYLIYLFVLCYYLNMKYGYLFPKIYNYRKSSFLNWIKTSGSLLLLHGSWLTRLKPDAETYDRCVLSDSVRSQK